jgi:hypothetical protein
VHFIKIKVFLDFSDKINRPRFLEDGGSSITVAAGGNEYPK